MTVINIITCYTLIDITHTGVVRTSSDSVLKRRRNQQRNYETLLQVIGLRAQPMLFENPYKLSNEDLSKYNFGSYFNGTHNVWILKFSIEHPDVFENQSGKLGLLEEDIADVPIITGLDETAELPLSAISSIGEFKNTYFTSSK